jgi:pyocin large subunit-like protein
MIEASNAESLTQHVPLTGGGVVSEEEQAAAEEAAAEEAARVRAFSTFTKAVEKTAARWNAVLHGESGIQAAEDSWAKSETLQDHFDRHGGQFGAKTPIQYAEKASKFLEEGMKEKYPTKVSVRGVIRIYRPSDNTFGAYNSDGTTRTFFKPDDGIEYWHTEGGRSPW